MRPRDSDPNAASTPGGDREDGLVDLPLRPGAGEGPPRDSGGDGAPGLAYDPREEPAAGAPGGASAPSPRHQKRPGSSRRLLWLIALVVLAVLAWIFFPSAPRAEFSWERVDLGTVRVGGSGDETTLLVTNRGERSLRIEGASITEGVAADYEWSDEGCVGSRLATDESCLIRIAFRPRSPGDRSGTFTIDSNDRKQPAVALEAVAIAPQLGLAPSTLAFGVVPLEGDAVSRTVTLSNVGSARLEFDRISIDGAARDDFDRNRRCPSPRLDPGEACSFDIRFKPSVSGPRRAALIVESDAFGGRGELPLEGTGLWEGPPLDPSQEVLDLGEQRLGQRGAPRTVTFVNRTGGPVSVSGTEVLKSSYFAIVEDDCRGSLIASGAGCSVSVTFLPVRDGSAEAALALSASGATESSTVELRGKGVTPRLEAKVTSLAFGEQRVGFESAPRTVTLANTGTATLALEAASIAGTDGTDFLVRSNRCQGEPLPAGEECRIGIGFSPSARGARSASLTLKPDLDLEPVEVELSGLGVVSALEAKPGRLDFGEVYLGGLERSRLTLTNAGSASLALAGLRFEGRDADRFRLGSTNCALDAGLAAGASCTLQVEFEPEREKPHLAELVLAYNGPDSPARVQLFGVAAEPAPAFRISETSLDLGSAPVGGRGEIGTVTIENPGAAWLDLISISLRGDHAEDFRLVAGTCDGVTALAPNGSCTVGVRLAPVTPGTRRGTILVRHGADSGVARVSLTGRGLE